MDEHPLQPRPSRDEAVCVSHDGSLKGRDHRIQRVPADLAVAAAVIELALWSRTNRIGLGRF